MNQVIPIEKEGKRVDDTQYRAYVRTFPCIICWSFDMTQTSRTEFHHTCSGRNSQAKTSCAFGIPLCDCHHKGQRFDRDRNKVAIHDAKETWEELYGLDTDWTRVTQDRVEREFGYTPKGIE